MNQTIRIIDPNYRAHRRIAYQDGGKSLISLMKSRGVSKDVRDDMRVYLADQQTKFKKTAMHKEVTRHGSPLTMAAFGSETVGIYNPDVIPIDTYIKMKQDPQVAIGLAMIKMPLYSLGWTIECSDPDIRAFVHEAMSRIWNRLIVSMLTAVDFGFASHEIIWELFDVDIFTQSPSGRKKTHFTGKAELFKKIKAHYPSTIRIRTDSKTDDFMGISQTVAGMGGQAIKLDANKCFLFTFGDEFGNFFGTSRMKAAYKSWYWKEVLTQFMLRYFERKGSPSTVVQHPIGGGVTLDGTEYDNSEIALRISQNLLENSSITLPYEADKEGRNQWDISYLQDDRRGEMFVNALNYFSAQILRGLLTPERVMTQDLSTGSFSMASSHAEIFLLSLEGMGKEISDAVNRQLIPQLVEFNFKPKKTVSCRLRVEKIQYDRRRILKEIMLEVIRNVGTWAKSGNLPSVMPSIEQMSDVLGVPIAPFKEEYERITGVLPEGGNIDDDKIIPAKGKKPEDEIIPAKGKKPAKKPDLKVVKKQSVKRYPISKRYPVGSSKEKFFSDMTKKDWLEAYKSGKTHWSDFDKHSNLAEVFVANEKINKTKGNILEIGCGGGADSSYFGEQGYNVISIDISSIAVRQAIKNNSHDNVEYLVGDAENLDFEDEQFDLIYSLSVLHSTNMKKSFSEVSRVLKEGGIVLVFLYKKTDYMEEDKDIRTEVNFDNDGITNIFDYNDLKVVESYDTESDIEKDENGQHKHFISVYLLRKILGG